MPNLEMKRRITNNIPRHIKALAKDHAHVRVLVNYGKQGSFWRTGSLLKTRKGQYLLTTPVSICTLVVDDIEQIVYTFRRKAS